MCESAKKVLPNYETLYPVPIVLVTCVDKKNNPNIITIAWCGVVSSAPPAISISIRPSRYSYELISQQKEFVVNIPNIDIAQQTDYCGFVSGRNTDKFKETGLTAITAKKVKSPLIKECPVNIECQLKQVIELGAHHMFIGEIVCVHADKDILDAKNIDYTKARPITYNQGEYWGLGEKIGYYGFSRNMRKD